MTHTSWQRLQEVFEAALQRPQESRRAFLVEACVDDAELLKEAESLVESFELAGSFLEEPAPLPAEATLRVGLVLAERYRIGRLIDRGGMGDVYEAAAVQWGGFNVSFEKALGDMDITPFLKGLPDNLDQCPHWGYVFKGKMIIRYKDHEETVNEGEAYYMAPGHTGKVMKGTELIEFSPVDEYQKTMTQVMKNWENMQSKK